MRRHVPLILLVVLPIGPTSASPAAASSLEDCFSDNNDRRIMGCSNLIESPLLDDVAKSLAFSRRALAFSLKRDYDRALPDYEMALRLDPGSSMAHNNRAWVLWRLGRHEEGLVDANQAIALQPESHHAFDTRAHLKQSLDEPRAAQDDYEQAMRLGGEKLIKLYQCGLEAQRLYTGPIDGLYTSDVRKALKTCVENRDCDPLPADEECRSATS
ncbi:MAG: tetratricopeptide repeat protein [Hyphomicrobium sp.]|jgi:tetratricopeptide (TPR) repeat protein